MSDVSPNGLPLVGSYRKANLGRPDDQYLDMDLKMCRYSVLELEVRCWCKCDAFPGDDVALYEFAYWTLAEFRSKVSDVIIDAHASWGFNDPFV